MALLGSHAGDLFVDRRLFAWLLICISMFLIFNSMQRQRELARLEQERQAELAEKNKEKKINESKAIAERIAKEDPTFTIPEGPARTRYTLGSMNPNDRYPFMITLDNLGATVERVELVDQIKPGEFRYRSLRSKEREGYLGYLALDISPNGLLVQSVPPGSAASLAVCKEDASLIGLQAGDTIVGWDGLSGFPSLYRLEKRFKDQAGKPIELKIERGSILVPNNAEKESDQQTAQKQALTFACTLTERPLDVIRAEDDFNDEQVSGNDPIGSCSMTLASIDKISIEEGEQSILGLERTLHGNWEAKPLEVPDGMGIEFVMPLQNHLRLAGVKANLELVKQYRLTKRSSSDNKGLEAARENHFSLTTIVRNLDDESHTLAVRQNGINGVSLEGWWYPTKISPSFFGAAGARDVILGDGYTSHSLIPTRTIVQYAQGHANDPEYLLFGSADNAEKRNVKYIGLDTQSFATAMLPAASTPDAMDRLARGKAVVLNSEYNNPEKLPAYKQQAANIGFWFETEAKTVPPKSELKLDYVLFAGPKDPNLLSAYKLEEAIYYGWQIFGYPAKALRLILHGFFSLTGNFGIAIIMLTVLVRSCMFPVSRKMAINAQKMQSVQPHMNKLKESLKEDPRKMMVAQQMLMKRAGVNQFAGCLPAMIQLPIVIGLYRCVSVDVALRQQPLIPGWNWCSNLAGPDMFLDWHSYMWDVIAGRGTGWFGPYLNILPLVTITLFIIQQKVLMPKATDEQTRVAQQMMMVMTVFMGVLFFRVPAGLCIYFITSSTWSLVERFLIKRFTPKASMVDLPENTASEIISAVAKGTTNVRPVTNTKQEDRPKPKAPKAPENLTELWEGIFGKRTQPNPAPDTSKRPSLPQPRKPKRKK